MKKVISLFIILLLIGCASNYKTISATEAHDMMKDNNKIVIIDVRDYDEYTKEHIENSINVPLNHIEDIDMNKDVVIIVYCLSGVRSKEASKKLISMGYTNVYNIDGGIINWGYELVND